MAASRHGTGNPKKRRKTSWKPGQTGNPKGRPKRDPDFVATMGRLSTLVLKRWKELLETDVARLRKEPRLATVVKGIGETVLAYAEGRPVQPFEHTGEGGGPIQVDLSVMSDEALAEYEKAVRAGKRIEDKKS